MRDDRTLDLFAHSSTVGEAGAALAATGAMVSVFPLDRRLGKIRDVATKLLAKTTERAVDAYRRQVTEALEVHLRSKRVPEDEHAGEIGRFWLAVDCEVARRLHGRRPSGGAA